MSEKSQNLPVIVTDEQPEETPKPKLTQRAKQFVKDHKKTTIAVGSLVALIGVASLTGRSKDAEVPFESPVADEPETDETDDTQSA